MKKPLLLFCLISLFCSFHATGRYLFSSLSLEDGLSQITVTAIHQDKKGYLWFGTRNGLNRYNGYTFEVFTTDPDNPNSISDNHILSILEDHEGYLWIGTNSGLNRMDPATFTFTRYMEESGNPYALSGNMVASLLCDEEGILWIGTHNGINRYDRESNRIIPLSIDPAIDHNPVYSILRYLDILYLGTATEGLVEWNIKTNQFKKHKKKKGEKNSIPDNEIRSVYMDNQNQIWVGSHHNGIGVMEPGSESFLLYNQENGLSNNYIRCITETPEGDIVAGTFNGLNLIDRVTGKVSHYQTHDSPYGSLSHYSIHSIYFDRSRTLWVGTYAGGINYHSDYGQKFRFFDPGSTLQSVTGIMGPMVKSGDYLYVATEGGGLLEMNLLTEAFRLYPLTDTKNDGYGHNIIKSLCLDGNTIYCGTNVSTIYSFDLASKKFTLFHDFNMGHGIYHLSKGKNGDLIVGGVNHIGVTLFTKEGRIIRNFPVNGDSRYFFNVRCIHELEERVYLIGTRNEGLYLYNMNNGELAHYQKTENGKPDDDLPENYVTSILEDSMGRIWIGTFGGGVSLFDCLNGKFKTYHTGHGLQENTVCMLVEDDDHYLWISTLSGIARFDPSGEKFTNYSYSGGIKVHEFTPHAGLKLSDQMILFSGNNGFLSFNPTKMSVNPYIPAVHLENLYIHNEKVIPSVNGKILSQTLGEQKSIVLKYNESNFTIEYSALNYIFSDRNRYLYMLEGFDNQWNEVGNRRTAYYTNVPPGKYRFLVRGSNNDDLWNQEGASLSIQILPPLWKTWWAYLLYFILLVSITFIILRYYIEKKQLENEVKLKQAEARAREEFHQERNRLFTNFSHELRTPLTLILSPLEDIILKGKEFPANVRRSHKIMYNNCLRMLRLVNNLMDFQKKESGKINLKVTENDFIEFSGDMFSLFNDLAESRQIRFEFISNEESVVYWFDKSLMEKVFFNFLSNAFKNVPNRGTIEVRIAKLNYTQLTENIPAERIMSFTNDCVDYIYIEIADSGPGIPEEELENIFAPFYQVAQNEHSVSGTGLGLSLSKSIIEMHHGEVWAENNKDKGACFRCILPVDKNIFKPEELLQSYAYEKQKAIQVEILETTPIDNPEKKKSNTLLIVEDNPEVRNFICEHLIDDYQLIEAGNGMDALDKAAYHLPDLIISDLMMPKMDGMEMTRKLKEDLRTSHIPVILLTARTMAEDVQVGYETGADDYITKPFSPSVLKARVNNIIQTREKLKEIYGKQFSLETLGVDRTSADDRFLQKLYQSMEKNISNPELNMDNFSKEIGMSRANLYRKIKSVTGLSPSIFIRNFRLEMAAKILREAQLPVSEVFVTVGFSSHAYFSSCFKALYGITPTEYALRKEEEKK